MANCFVKLRLKELLSAEEHKGLEGVFFYENCILYIYILVQASGEKMHF